MAVVHLLFDWELLFKFGELLREELAISHDVGVDLIRLVFLPVIVVKLWLLSLLKLRCSKFQILHWVSLFVCQV